MLSLSKSARRLVMGAAGVAVLAGIAGCGGHAATASTPQHSATPAAQQSATPKPTVVLVHGAWADGSSWDQVTAKLQQDGYNVVVPPDLLTGVSRDAADLRSYLNTITGPIVLVGHSYAGMVTTNAALGDKQVKALVYVDAYIPDKGDSVLSLTGAKPGSAFAANPATLFNQVPIPGNAKEANLYVKPSVFGKAFVGNAIPADQVAVAAARQRPLASGALQEKSGAPAWTAIPSWSVIGKQDAIIPPAEQVAMSTRAKAHTLEIDAPHLSMVTAPDAVTGQIENAAKAAN
ncbi:alpha/beta hydrolase [Actinoplanes sp. TBRC 11911]|uniref:alpha/beta fold hydrolase n=1 Tax=Actinoplanes sp. TBRC 11911 TaxID=2729386 RepID=UPI00145CA371|nr:alpha/beta hydrolase [Actinoplanes sp. TBRC 11911]NMO49942.1 alpha/beta hydrolase [Actinoplanes sp. TBRC 11911]